MLKLKDFLANEISELNAVKGGKEWVMSIHTDTGCYDLYDDGSIEGPPVGPDGEK